MCYFLLKSKVVLHLANWFEMGITLSGIIQSPIRVQQSLNQNVMRVVSPVYTQNMINNVLFI